MVSLFGKMYSWYVQKNFDLLSELHRNFLEGRVKSELSKKEMDSGFLFSSFEPTSEGKRVCDRLVRQGFMIKRKTKYLKEIRYFLTERALSLKF